MSTQATNVIQKPSFESDKATKLQVVKTEQLAVDALYLKPGQQHGPFRLPARDRAVIVLEGALTIVLHVTPIEERIEGKPGEVVLAPKGVWHTLMNLSGQNVVAVLGSQFPVQVEERG